MRIGSPFRQLLPQHRVLSTAATERSTVGAEIAPDLGYHLVCCFKSASFIEIRRMTHFGDIDSGYSEPVVATQLRALDEQLLAGGENWLTVASAVERTGRSVSGVRSLLQRLLDQRRLVSPARGFYVVVPAEYRSWGVVPATWFIDPMMRHLGREYYVSLLSAAEVHGAAHQRPQVFQVITDRPVRDRDIERVQLRVYTKRSINSSGVQRVNSHTGTMAVSNPELTVIDMAGQLDHVGGLDALATVIDELAGDAMLDGHRFADVAAHEPRASVRRAGWIIEHLTDLRLDSVAAEFKTREPVNLDPFGERRGHVDPRWGVRVNAHPEPES